jgi:hypothetical protein
MGMHLNLTCVSTARGCTIWLWVVQQRLPSTISSLLEHPEGPPICNGGCLSFKKTALLSVGPAPISVPVPGLFLTDNVVSVIQLLLCLPIEWYAYHCSWVPLRPSDADFPAWTGEIPLLFLSDYPNGSFSFMIHRQSTHNSPLINQSTCTGEHVEILWSGTFVQPCTERKKTSHNEIKCISKLVPKMWRFLSQAETLLTPYDTQHVSKGNTSISKWDL